MTLTATETTAAEWTDVGAKVLPPYARDQFLTAVESATWREPEGMMPMSPALSLQTVIHEFDIRPVTAVSHSVVWEAHDTTGRPGRHGDYTCTYTVLGVRTRKQSIYFLDGGCAVTPVLIVTHPRTSSNASPEETRDRCQASA